MKPRFIGILSKFHKEMVHITILDGHIRPVLKEAAVQAFGLAEGDVKIGHLQRISFYGTLHEGIPTRLSLIGRNHAPLEAGVDNTLMAESPLQGICRLLPNCRIRSSSGRAAI